MIANKYLLLPYVFNTRLFRELCGAISNVGQCLSNLQPLGQVYSERKLLSLAATDLAHNEKLRSDLLENTNCVPILQLLAYAVRLQYNEITFQILIRYSASLVTFHWTLHKYEQQPELEFVSFSGCPVLLSPEVLQWRFEDQCPRLIGTLLANLASSSCNNGLRWFESIRKDLRAIS